MPKLVEYVFHEHCFYNAITEANTYFKSDDAGTDIKAKVINSEIFSTKPLTEIDKEIIIKLHYESNA